MEKTSDKLLSIEAARSNTYRLLADAYRLPSEDLPGVVQALVTALSQLESEALESAICLENGGLDSNVLQVDYAKLFIGPFMALAPPYGSIYLEDKRRLMGDSTVDVRQHYLSLGLDLSVDFKEAPDHITAELEFMHVLINQAEGAIEDLDGQLLSENIHHQQIFLEKHLGAWITAFADKMAEHANTDYYRNLATLTRIFITEDMVALPN
ncbi:MAG: molecular chaperone TorD family protein [Desulfobacterium sp.]|jgi:TorA maturation chaperone TorD|nr:molecular chaperone TorD family protein [Desulfobacterium sp.]